MNLAVAAFNIACAVYWLCMNEPFGAVASIAGAYASIVAYKWAQV